MMLAFQTKQGRILISIEDIWGVLEMKGYCDLVTSCMGHVSVEHSFEEVAGWIFAGRNVWGLDEEEDDED